MEFLKERVYTALNADEVKVGSKVIVADNMASLKNKVEQLEYGNRAFIHILKKVLDEGATARFVTEGDEGDDYSYLCYLIEPPEEKVLKWTDLKLGDVIRHKSSTIETVVVALDKATSAKKHVCVAFYDWLFDEELKDWEKVE
jgi:hypothetical protein